MGQGLYQIVREKNGGDLSSEDIDAVICPEMTGSLQERLREWAKELKFWEDYAQIYHHIEDTRSYNELVEVIDRFLNPQEGEVWLDAGCGPARMSQLVWIKSKKRVKKIVGIDIVLGPARRTLIRNSLIPLELQRANLGERLPFPDEFFDGIVANLVLTYVIDFEGKKGREAFVEVMKEMFRILKPGGYIVWSTPKKNPFFLRNFLVGLPDMLSIRKQIRHRSFGLWVGTRILRYGLGITAKGRKGIYTFLTPIEYEEILREIGFENFEWVRTFADQAWVNKAEKPSANC